MRSHPHLLYILQKRLYSGTKPSEVDFILRWACKIGNEGLASAMLGMGADILLSVICSCQFPSSTKVVFHAGPKHYHLYYFLDDCFLRQFIRFIFPFLCPHVAI